MRRLASLLLVLAACDKPSGPPPGPSTIVTVPPAGGTSNPPIATGALPQEKIPVEMTQGLERVDAGDLAGAKTSFEKALGRGHVPSRAWIERLKTHGAASPPLAEPGWPKPPAAEKPTFEPAAENGYLKLDREAKEKAASDPAAAEKLFAAIEAKFPASMESSHNRAVCLALQGRWAEALETERRCVLDLGARHHLMAGALLEAGKLDEALDAAVRAVETEPRAKIAYVRRAAIYEKLKKVEECVLDLGTAISLDPGDLALREKRIALCVAKGDPAGGLQDLDAMIEAKDDPKLRLRRARILVAIGNASQALVDYDALVKASAEDFDLRLERVEALLKGSKLEEAKAELTWCIARKPSAELYARRAQIYIEEHTWGPAEADIKRALELDEKNFRAHYWAGWMHKEKREFQKAQAHFQRAAELKPEFGETYYHLVQVHGNLKQYEKAQEALVKARNYCGPEFKDNLDFLERGVKSQIQRLLDNALKAAWTLLESNKESDKYAKESGEATSDGDSWRVVYKGTGQTAAVVILVNKKSGAAAKKE